MGDDGTVKRHGAQYLYAGYKYSGFPYLFPSAVTRDFAQRVGFGNRIVLCDYVVEELRLVVERKFPNRKKILEQFFYELPFELVYTPKELNAEEFPSVRDTKDFPILATAIMENVDVLVTGDKDLRVVEIEYPEIMTMSEFMEKY